MIKMQRKANQLDLKESINFKNHVILGLEMKCLTKLKDLKTWPLHRMFLASWRICWPQERTLSLLRSTDSSCDLAPFSSKDRTLIQTISE